LASGEAEAEVGAKATGIIAKLAEEQFGKDAAEVTAGDVTMGVPKTVTGDAASRPPGDSVVLDDMHLSSKIVKQMSKRGWTRESVEDTIMNPHRTARTRDTRWRPD
jgi:hypothetical protein